MKIAEGVNSLLQMAGLLARLCQKTMAPVASQSGGLIAGLTESPRDRTHSLCFGRKRPNWDSPLVIGTRLLVTVCGPPCASTRVSRSVVMGKGCRGCPGHNTQSGCVLAFQLIKLQVFSNNVAVQDCKSSQLPVSACCLHPARRKGDLGDRLDKLTSIFLEAWRTVPWGEDRVCCNLLTIQKNRTARGHELFRKD